MIPRRAFTPAEHAKIDAMLRDGESVAAIARAIGRRPHVVARYAERMGLYEQHERRLPPADCAGIVIMYEQRRTIAAIQRRYGVCASTIYRVLDAADVARHYPQRGIAPRRRMRMLALHRQEAPTP